MKRFRLYDLDSKRYLKGDFSLGVESGEVRGKYGEVFKNIIVEQFTGLKDKNGVKIFEGDIIMNNHEDKTIVEYGIQLVDAFEGVGFNLWDFYGEKADQGKAIRLQNSIEIIGNIHE